MPWNPVYPIENGRKKCIRCLEEYNLDFFPKQKKCKEGVKPTCKKCQRITCKKYYEENKEKVLVKARNYGQTEYRKEYCRNFAKNRLKKIREINATRQRPTNCECCGEVPKQKGIVWDHDHKTGEFRGWLCNRCNRVLGMCKDSKEILNRLFMYLENYG